MANLEIFQQFKDLSVRKKIALVMLYCIYLSGFIFNIWQNPNAIFSKPWIYDYFILAYTNLLGIPLLVSGLFSNSKKLGTKFQNSLEFKGAIYTPFIFLAWLIFGTLFGKILDFIFAAIAWLGR